MVTYIALLRGINVGGNNKVPMSELRNLASDLGLTEPKTLIQSGNLTFKASRQSCEDLEGVLEEGLEKLLGLKIQLMVRTLAEWEEIIAANPFAKEADADPSHLLLIALKQEPDFDLVRSMQVAMLGPEKFVGVGRELYVVYPEGIGDSKIGKTPGWNKLASTGTGRNWNTVLKLMALAGDIE